MSVWLSLWEISESLRLGNASGDTYNKLGTGTLFFGGFRQKFYLILLPCNCLYNHVFL
jgi:hypothetical protein